MAREAKTKTINETVYTVYQLAPMPALNLLIDIAGVAGPGLGPLLSNMGSNIDRELTEIPELGNAIAKFTESLSKNKELLASTIKLLSGVTVIGTPGKEAKLSAVFDAHFAAVGLGELFQWIAFAVHTQYDDFLGALGNVIKSARPQVRATVPQ